MISVQLDVPLDVWLCDSHCTVCLSPYGMPIIRFVRTVHSIAIDAKQYRSVDNCFCTATRNFIGCTIHQARMLLLVCWHWPLSVHTHSATMFRKIGKIIENRPNILAGNDLKPNCASICVKLLAIPYFIAWMICDLIRQNQKAHLTMKTTCWKKKDGVPKRQCGTFNTCRSDRLASRRDDSDSRTFVSPFDHRRHLLACAVTCGRWIFSSQRAINLDNAEWRTQLLGMTSFSFISVEKWANHIYNTLTCCKYANVHLLKATTILSTNRFFCNIQQLVSTYDRWTINSNRQLWSADIWLLSVAHLDAANDKTGKMLVRLSSVQVRTVCREVVEQLPSRCPKIQDLSFSIEPLTQL